MSDDDWDDNSLAPTPSTSHARVATNESSSLSQNRITDNLALSNHFKNSHIIGSHNPRPLNTVADFKSAKYKSAIKIENVQGKYPGQIKVITKYPSKYFESGWKHYGEEGEAYFLLTGIKTGKRFVAQHLDSMLTKRDDGKFETPEGKIYIYNTDSDTAEYSSGHDFWGEEGKNNSASSMGETEYFTCNEILDNFSKMDLKVEKGAIMKKKLNDKSKDRNESSDSEDLTTLSMRRKKETNNDQENTNGKWYANIVKRTESTASIETSDNNLHESDNIKKKKNLKKKYERKSLSKVDPSRFKSELLNKQEVSLLREFEEDFGKDFIGGIELSKKELSTSKNIKFLFETMNIWGPQSFNWYDKPESPKRKKFLKCYYDYLMASKIFKFNPANEEYSGRKLNEQD